MLLVRHKAEITDENRAGLRQLISMHDFNEHLPLLPVVSWLVLPGTMPSLA